MKSKKIKKRTTPKKVNPARVPKKNNTDKWIMAGLAGATVAGLTYFGWRLYKKSQEASGAAVEPLPAFTFPSTPPYTTPVAPVSVYQPTPKPRPQNRPQPDNMVADSFPLKRGSRGDHVNAFQQALINVYGKEILPRYGADGQFGTELVAALKKLKLPAKIDQTTFNILVKGSGTSQSAQGSAQASIARSLIDAAGKKDFTAAIKALRLISSTDQYSTVNSAFKSMRINGGVRQTLVTGMLNAFSEEKQKREIRLEFQRMGLVYDGSKWSLSGLDGLTIVTIATATVWANAKQQVQVPARTVLGTEIARRLDYTLFENKGKHFLVQTSNVTYL